MTLTTSPSVPHRIGLGGIAIESSTFSPLHSTIDDFRIRAGDEMQEMYPYLPNWTYRDRDDIAFLPCYKARAIPGGQVTAEAYREMKSALLDRVREALPMDGFFFDVHGAMSVVGMDDAEGDLAKAIREIVGPDCIISAGMDLHGNVSEQLVSQIDVFTCYREAPHIDAMETKERAVTHLLHCLDTGTRPMRAFVRIPVMLPGERTSTFVEPGKTVYGRLTESDAVAGVIDPSLWVGYVWADQPRTNATVVVSGTDAAAIAREAQIARRYRDARHDFQFGVPTGPADWTIDAALKLGQKAVIISDPGDNPTAGGAGDVPFMVERLLAREELASGSRTAIVAAVPNADAVDACRTAGVGNQATVTIGGVLDPVNGAPLELSGTVHAIQQQDDPVGGDVAVLRVGGVHVIIPTRRKPYHRMADFEAVDLRVVEHDLTVVKIGYLEPELHEVASSAFLALSPGAVNQDIPSLPFERVNRPIYPLDPDMPDPDLTPMLFDPIA